LEWENGVCPLPEDPEIWSKHLSQKQLPTLLACLHDQSKSGYFGGPAFENFSDCSDWLDKCRPSKKATFILIM